MTWYALCAGKGLRICEHCLWLSDNNPEASERPYQAWLIPAVRNEQCGDWVASPHSALDASHDRL